MLQLPLPPEQMNILTQKRVGILGGSFDPIHNGHLRLATHFAKILNLSKLIFMIAPRPWQKMDIQTLTPIQFRLKLLNLALKDLVIGNTIITVGKDEINRQGPTYTIETLEKIRKKLGNGVFLSLLIGSDQFYSLPSWHRWENIFDFAHVCVAARETLSKQFFQKKIKEEMDKRECQNLSELFKEDRGRIYFSKEFNYKISSTHIRSILKDSFHEKNSIPDTRSQYLVESLPGSVLDYLKKYNIYQQKNYERSNRKNLSNIS